MVRVTHPVQEREIPIPAKLVKSLKSWKAKANKACNLVFPTARCNPKEGNGVLPEKKVPSPLREGGAGRIREPFLRSGNESRAQASPAPTAMDRAGAVAE
jgi:hypothetical protein